MIGFLLSPIGRYVAISLGAIFLLCGIYTKGYSDGRSAYKAKIERQIDAAIKKGDAARERALRDFDANPDGLPDDGFRRD